MNPIPILRQQDLALLYEVNAAIPETTALGAVASSGHPASAQVLTWQPLATVGALLPDTPGSWSSAFAETSALIDTLRLQEAKDGLQPTVHLFGCAPLPLMFHLGWRLSRHPFVVYQQARDSGAWQVGYDRTALARADTPDFFEVNGLPEARRPGRGQVAVLVEVTRDISDAALGAFRARHPEDLLAEIHLKPVGGPSATAVSGPDAVARAVAQFRQVLDTLHLRLPGAEAVLLALSCPASFAAALGTAVNPLAQLPLRLHNYRPHEGYVPVSVLDSKRPARGPREPEGHELLEATRVLEGIHQLHEDLKRWLGATEQQDWLRQEGYTGVLDSRFLESRISTTPVLENAAMFAYLHGVWRFPVGLLGALGRLRVRIGEERWAECIRLILLHEAYHPRQQLSSYDYQGVGRTGFVLEAVDFDADVFSVEACLQWRRTQEKGTVDASGEVRILARILQNVLEALRAFDPEPPFDTLSERRLRRHLIWLFQASRAQLFEDARDVAAFAPRERVFIELTGLKATPDPSEASTQFRVALTPPAPGQELLLAVYHRGRLYRWKDTRQVGGLLAAFRKSSLDEVSHAFAVLFHEHPNLVRRL